MIKGLILNGWSRSKDATIAFMAIGVFVWGLLQVITLILDKVSPTAFHQEIMKAEARSRAYVDEKTAYGEKIVDLKHQEVMGVMGEIKGEIRELRTDIKDIYKNKGVAGLPDLRGGVN